MILTRWKMNILSKEILFKDICFILTIVQLVSKFGPK